MLYAPASDALKPVTVGNSLFSAKVPCSARGISLCGAEQGLRPQCTGIAAKMDARTRRKAPKWPEIFSISLLFSLLSGKARGSLHLPLEGEVGPLPRRGSGPGGGDSGSAYAASLSPHPRPPKAVRPSPLRPPSGEGEATPFTPPPSQTPATRRPPNNSPPRSPP